MLNWEETHISTNLPFFASSPTTIQLYGSSQKGPGPLPINDTVRIGCRWHIWPKWARVHIEGSCNKHLFVLKTLFGLQWCKFPISTWIILVYNHCPHTSLVNQMFQFEFSWCVWSQFYQVKKATLEIGKDWPFKSLAGTNSTFKISGVWIQLLNPKVYLQHDLILMQT